MISYDELELIESTEALRIILVQILLRVTNRTWKFNLCSPERWSNSLGDWIP